MANTETVTIGRVSGLAGFVNISAYWFSLYYMWGSLNPIIMPALVLNFVPESFKGTSLGLITGAGLLLAMVVQPCAGAVSDGTCTRWGRRRPFVAIGSLLDVAFLIVIATAGSYHTLFLGYFLLQLASNLAHGPYEGLIPDLIPLSARGRAAGFAGIAQLGGRTTGIFAAGFFLSRGQLNLAIASIIIIVLAGMLITFFLVPDVPPPARTQRSALDALRRTFDRDVLRYKDFLWLLMSRYFILLGLASVSDFALYYIRDVLQVPNPAWATSKLMAAIIACSVITVLPAGFLSDRYGRKKIVLFTCLAGTVGSILFFTATDYAMLLTFGIIIGIGMGSFISVDWAFATDLIPKSQAGRFMGLSNIATAGAGASAFLFGGPVIDYFNSQALNLGYRALMFLILAYFVVGTLTLLKVREHEVED